MGLGLYVRNHLIAIVEVHPLTQLKVLGLQPLVT